MEYSISTIYILVALLLSVLGYSLFVLLSVAILRSRRSVLDRELEGKTLGSAIGLKVLNRADRYLLTTQVGKFLCSCIIGALTLMLFLLVVRESPPGSILYTSPVMDAAFALLLVFIIAGLTLATVQFVKAVGYNAPESVLLYGGWVLLVFVGIFAPFRAFANTIVSFSLSLAGIQKPAERELNFSAEDLEEVIEQSTQAGTLEESESELLQGALRLSEVRIKEIMTPRADIVYVEMNDSPSEIVEKFVGAGFSRLLVINDQLDDVKGMVLAKDLTPFIGRSLDTVSLEQLLREVVFVDGELTADEVMRRLRMAQSHFGVVLDEHGGVDGIITLEDLMEEIVGDIYDETDIAEEEVEAVRTKSGDLLVDGGMTLADLCSGYGLELPEGEYDTVAGFIIEQLGRIPNQGDSLSFDGSTLTVEEVEENRIIQLRISDIQS